MITVDNFRVFPPYNSDILGLGFALLFDHFALLGGFWYYVLVATDVDFLNLGLIVEVDSTYVIILIDDYLALDFWVWLFG